MHQKKLPSIAKLVFIVMAIALPLTSLSSAAFAGSIGDLKDKLAAANAITNAVERAEEAAGLAQDALEWIVDQSDAVTIPAARATGRAQRIIGRLGQLDGDGNLILNNTVQNLIDEAQAALDDENIPDLDDALVQIAKTVNTALEKADEAAVRADATAQSANETVEAAEVAMKAAAIGLSGAEEANQVYLNALQKAANGNPVAYVALINAERDLYEAWSAYIAASEELMWTIDKAPDAAADARAKLDSAKAALKDAEGALVLLTDDLSDAALASFQNERNQARTAAKKAIEAALDSVTYAKKFTSVASEVRGLAIDAVSLANAARKLVLDDGILDRAAGLEIVTQYNKPGVDQALSNVKPGTSPAGMWDYRIVVQNMLHIATLLDHNSTTQISIVSHTGHPSEKSSDFASYDADSTFFSEYYVYQVMNAGDELLLRVTIGDATASTNHYLLIPCTRVSTSSYPFMNTLYFDASLSRYLGTSYITTEVFRPTIPTINDPARPPVVAPLIMQMSELVTLLKGINLVVPEIKDPDPKPDPGADPDPDADSKPSKKAPKAGDGILSPLLITLIVGCITTGLPLVGSAWYRRRNQ